MITPAVRRIEERGLIVSCQARADNPLHGALHMTAMALAALQGGARGIRANGAADIAAIRRVVDVPIIGINKRFDQRFPVYITPDLPDIIEVANAGADIIAIDATARPRDSLPLRELVPAARAACPHVLLMADIATIPEAEAAAALGFDYVATTLSGFTEETAHRRLSGPDLDLAASLAKHLGVPVIAEGGFDTPDQVRAAFAHGAFAVVVGTAITNPREITRRFAAATRS